MRRRQEIRSRVLEVSRESLGSLWLNACPAHGLASTCGDSEFFNQTGKVETAHKVSSSHLLCLSFSVSCCFGASDFKLLPFFLLTFFHFRLDVEFSK